MTRSLSRRDLLKAGAGFALGGALLSSSCGGDDGEPAANTPEPEETAESTKTRVAAIRGNDLGAMTRDALAALGGVEAFVHEGETVFIKPNFVTMGWASAGRNPFSLGECTKPEILAAVAEECLKVGAREVIIGDATQVSSFSWEYATWLDGSTNLLAEARRLESQFGGKVTLACLDADSTEWVEVPSRTGLGKIAVSGLVANADRVISIPVLKTHQWAQLTLALKNFIGTAPLARYNAKTDGTTPRLAFHMQPEGIEQVFLDIVAGVKPDLAIIDCSIGVEGDGPAVSKAMALTADMREKSGSWLLLAGPDLAAADATAARIISHDVATIRQLQMAQEQGLGETREEAIELVGERLDDLRVEWKPATPASPTQLSKGLCPIAECGLRFL